MTKNMIAVLGALAGFAAAAAVHAETVTVNGSTTVLPAMQLTAEGFMKANPNITVTTPVPDRATASRRCATA